MIGALALGAGALLLAVGALRVGDAEAQWHGLVPPRGYVRGWVQLVVVLGALSLFGWVTRWGVLAGLALTCGALLLDTRGWSDVGDRARTGLATS